MKTNNNINSILNNLNILKEYLQEKNNKGVQNDI